MWFNQGCSRLQPNFNIYLIKFSIKEQCTRIYAHTLPCETKLRLLLRTDVKIKLFESV